MKIKNTQGAQIPLQKLCDFSMGRAPESLKRLNGQRIVKIDAETIDPDKVADINKKIFDSLIPKVSSLYPKVSALKLGQFERSQKTGGLYEICYFGPYLSDVCHINASFQ